MSSKDDTNVHDLLNTLLVPTYPPNRSQWKKLELALKFINMSKKRVRDTINAKKAQKVVHHESEGNVVEKTVHQEPAGKKPRMMLIEPCNTVDTVHKGESSWTKIKDSFQNML